MSSNPHVILRSPFTTFILNIVAQEASAKATMPTTARPDLNSTSGSQDRPTGPALLLNGYSQRRTRAL